ncbi:hypothetical protein [Roseibium sp.]|uniref:hypothetical protein n=1 Tax=Roseibium sp. TaxID=1936156 RepID=UPI003267A45D
MLNENRPIHLLECLDALIVDKRGHIDCLDLVYFVTDRDDIDTNLRHDVLYLVDLELVS